MSPFTSILFPILFSCDINSNLLSQTKYLKMDNLAPSKSGKSIPKIHLRVPLKSMIDVISMKEDKIYQVVAW